MDRVCGSWLLAVVLSAGAILDLELGSLMRKRRPMVLCEGKVRWYWGESGRQYVQLPVYSCWLLNLCAEHVSNKGISVDHKILPETEGPYQTWWSSDIRRIIKKIKALCPIIYKISLAIPFNTIMGRFYKERRHLSRKPTSYRHISH